MSDKVSDERLREHLSVGGGWNAIRSLTAEEVTALATELLALRAQQQAAGWRAKPLVWVSDGTHFQAIPLSHMTYYISPLTGDRQWELTLAFGGITVLRDRHDGPAAAKAAAQSDYAARINSAIEPAPVADGYVMVPVEITEEMWTAFFKARDETFPEQMNAAREAGRGWTGLPAVVWEAMLAARPISASGRDGE